MNELHAYQDLTNNVAGKPTHLVSAAINAFPQMIKVFVLMGGEIQRYPSLTRYEEIRHLLNIVQRLSAKQLAQPDDMKVSNSLEACIEFSREVVKTEIVIFEKLSALASQKQESSLIFKSHIEPRTNAKLSNTTTFSKKGPATLDDIGSLTLSKLSQHYVHYLATLDSFRSQEMEDIASQILKREPLLDETQRVLTERASLRKSKLTQEHVFLNSAEFAGLIPARIQGDSNPSRSLERLSKAGSLIGMKIGGKMQYPLDQIDPTTGDVYPQISGLLKKSVHKGLSHWDVFDWLVRPQTVLPEGEQAGDASDIPSGLSGKALVEAIEKSVENATKKPVIDVVPLELLKIGESALFNTLAGNWIGETPKDGK